MPEESLSFIHYLIGIGVAIMVFLIRELINHAKYGLLFRKQLVLDIKILVENFYQHLPKLSKQTQEISAALDVFQSGKKPDISLFPIWSNEFSLIGQLYRNSSYLNVDVFQEAVSFYDIDGRVNEERKDYNEMVKKISESNKYTDRSIKFIKCCLTTMSSDYCRLIECGCKVLILIVQKHSFLNVDVSLYRNRLLKTSEYESSKK
ncbi:MAG TPA: hypothetical protein ENO17_01650 [Candidatus Atribacteria bacterium]|nr:hypothetical protein [Candidatus Atribacteria bacterium]